LTAQGATIQELNTVRKHLSLARGGNMAAGCKAKLFALIFSDVPGDDISFIASGPTVFDATSREDARALLEKYHAQEIGFSDVNLLETPKDQTLFANTKNILALTNQTALEAMQQKAQALGFEATIVNTQLKGDAEQVAREIIATLRVAPLHTVLLYGGETTVAIHGNGKGGRNQHLALAALSEIRDGELLLALASDGHDNTDHAGAVADMVTYAHAQEKQLDPSAFLQNSDSYTFFKQLENDAIITGLTGSNVADFIIALKA
jgi:glycerate-2-kinase